MPRPGCLIGAAAVGLALCGGTAAAQVEVTPAQLLGLARAALEAGAAGDARRYAEGLLARDPSDPDALTIVAEAALSSGDEAAARQAAAALYRDGRLPRAARYRAARLAAFAAAREERFLLSQIWLRRALTVAPDAAAEAQTIRDAASVRRQSPLSVELRFGVAPSDNVNNGSTTPDYVVDGEVLGGLSAGAQALSGWVGTGSVALAYRLSESPTQRTLLRLDLSTRRVWLSEESERALQDGALPWEEPLDAEDFGSARAAIGLSHDRALGGGALGLSATLGRSWTAGDVGYDFLALDADWARPLGEERILRLSVGTEWRDRPELDTRERLDALTATWQQGWSGGVTSVTLGAEQLESENANARATTLSFGLGHRLPQQVGPALVTLSATYAVTDYPDYTIFDPRVVGFVRVGRDDRRLSGRIEAALVDWSWAGFVPVVSLDGAATDSNVSRFETSSVGLGVEVRSAF
ncbi:hypothetical protein [Wenxinia marina]|uniref:Tetratricopeptide repeat protein n=1 Tax=Wenxinia marina DSM 24838 TaxID=1123501 RepID=A0A0D0PFH8_9RHOB|nr:hypothetical protein [Wenxinia marina]KIQ70101.1 hypothetical protein Wenmar_01673 [Wenxinia marina DSM 24838]GGL63472.1 hypothetical protein GCM10011392_17720 [Wenxinia marina]